MWFCTMNWQLVLVSWNRLQPVTIQRVKGSENEWLECTKWTLTTFFPQVTKWVQYGNIPTCYVSAFLETIILLVITQMHVVSLLALEAAGPCIHRRRWQRRQHKPSAGCMRLPEGRAGLQGHRGSGRTCGSGIYGTYFCLSPSPLPAVQWSLWCLQQRSTGDVGWATLLEKSDDDIKAFKAKVEMKVSLGGETDRLKSEIWCKLKLP